MRNPSGFLMRAPSREAPVSERLVKMNKLRLTIAFASLTLGGFIFLEQPSAATAKLALKETSGTATITVANGYNTYGDAAIKIVKPKKYQIVKTRYRVADNSIAMVDDYGVVVARAPGTTRIKVRLSYKKNKKAGIRSTELTYRFTAKAEMTEPTDQKEMQFDQQGRSMPCFPFSGFDVYGGWYSNDTSYIQRFPVYVETEYDTDQDGKRDLLPVIIQVPISAVQGEYRAPALFIAEPYLTEEIEEDSGYYYKGRNGAFDYDKLTVSPAKRQPKSTVATKDVVSGASVYMNEMEKHGYKTGNLSENDYFLARGYAVVTSAGLGASWDSEGLQLCGEKAEAEAFAAVVEWLHGDRQAFADRAGTKAISADWCNGHTAMTGLSYLGTLAYEVATTGVKGLDTVIPMGAISSWYDYEFSQGAIVNPVVEAYTSFLGQSCANRFKDLDKHKNKGVNKVYMNYLKQVNFDGAAALGRYDEFWARFDFRNPEKIRVPAMIVQGLNDYNVDGRQAYRMRETFRAAGQEVKMIYHQGGHEEICNDGEMKVNGEYFHELMDRWFTHYLMGVENGVENIPDYLIQSNTDGSWKEYSDDTKTESRKITPTSSGKETKVSFNGGDSNNTWWMWENERNRKGLSAIFEEKVEEETTLFGRGEVHIRAKMPDVKKNTPIMSVLVVDESDTGFKAYDYDKGSLPSQSIEKYYPGKLFSWGETIGTMSEVEYAQKKTKAKLITQGWINLLMPNAGWDLTSIVSPDEPVKKNTYYDYTLHLVPTYYTLKKGHKLKFYIVGPSGMLFNSSSCYLTYEYEDDLSNDIRISCDYSFTVDNKSVSAELTVLK